MDQEYESMIDIKVSNQIRAIKQSMNDRLQEIQEDYNKNLRDSLGDLREKFQQMDVTTHSLKIVNDQNADKLKQVEQTLGEQVDLIHGINDKTSQAAERMNQQVQALIQRQKQIDAKLAEMERSFSENNGSKKALDEL